MTSDSERAKELVTRYDKEVRRRVQANDWPKIDPYGAVQLPCTMPVAVPYSILIDLLAAALADARREALEEAAEHQLYYYATGPECNCGEKPTDCYTSRWWSRHIIALQVKAQGAESEHK
jgi:hypothetical protein